MKYIWNGQLAVWSLDIILKEEEKLYRLLYQQASNSNVSNVPGRSSWKPGCMSNLHLLIAKVLSPVQESFICCRTTRGSVINSKMLGWKTSTSWFPVILSTRRFAPKDGNTVNANKAICSCVCGRTKSITYKISRSNLMYYTERCACNVMQLLRPWLRHGNYEIDIKKLPKLGN